MPDCAPYSPQVSNEQLALKDREIAEHRQRIQGLQQVRDIISAYACTLYCYAIQGTTFEGI